MSVFIEYALLFSFLTGCGLFFSLPWFGFVDDTAESASNHNNSMDSLRFFLASFVFISHEIGFFYYFTDGKFTHPFVGISMLSHVGVALFFSITGYLFWGKIKRGSVNWISLYKGRFFRIVPLVWFNSLLIILIVCFLSREMPSMNALHWFDFINNHRPDFTSYKETFMFTAGVFWTLAFEWGFYIALPALSLIVKRSFEFSMFFVFVLVYASPYITLKVPFNFFLFFAIGMLASDVAEKINLQQKHFNFIFISSLIALLFCDDRIYRVDSFSNVLLFLIILSVAKGADLFGLLRIRGFRRLGVASYSIYVMHAFVIMCVFKLFNSLGILKNNPITIMLPLSISVLYISLITYHLIEKRFMTLGRGVKFNAPALTDKNANQIEKP
ncbi:acyltransferase family protein [Enterobacter kobei]|uniref:acyltransferase family protein n=1 Tax=Enterobacter kobei TaxID=208224 RepID=UPI00124C89E0|nr:acyltransferase [Enterobacter kobei]MCD0236501.1 acyltransferase [Enterobacter kobei]QFH91363.1 acyltransferase [Enterobacter kobei]